MQTRTGSFPIGFRRGWTDWQKDLDALLPWALAQGLRCVDLGKDGDQTGQRVLAAGLSIGSLDLANWQGMISPDRGKRAAALAENTAYIRTCAAFGPMRYFLVMLPEEPARPRKENFAFMVESFGELAPVLEENNASLVIEGWPGPGALCCTPEGYRALFAEVPSPAMGINYDPSHLIRMQIDPLRFLHEFVGRVYHVHGKDTELLNENLYDFGSEQSPTFATPRSFSGMHWRYTIPGHGVTRWTDVFRTLQRNGYAGAVSIELEDADFWGTSELEQAGIVEGARYLTGC